MKCYAIIGAKKCGKTTAAKRIVNAIGAPSLVYDKNKEWGASTLPKMSEFLAQAQKVRGRVIVWEDAGIFFPNNGRSAQLLDILTAARHTRNTSLLLFHSLRSVPLYVLDHLDGLYILPTRDLSAKVSDRFGDWPDVVNAWEDVMHEVARTGAPSLVEGVRLAGFPSRFVEL